jgi:hypothetical protein
MSKLLINDAYSVPKAQYTTLAGAQSVALEQECAADAEMFGSAGAKAFGLAEVPAYIE